MKIRIKRKLLEDALNKVKSALTGRSLIPALSGIKFVVEKSRLVLTTADSEANMTIQVELKKKKGELEIDEEGSLIIPNNIIEIVNKLDEEILEISAVDGVKVLLRTESGNYDLNGFELSEYPNIDLSLNKNLVTLDSEEFKTAINQISFVTSNDEGRPILTGINLKINNKEIELSATDSFRAARKTFDFENKLDEEFDIIIPSKSVNEYIKIVNTEENTDMYIFDNKIILKNDNLLFQSRLISGNFPNIKNVFPKEELFHIKLDKNNFYNVIDRASIFTSDKEKNVITLITDKDKVIIKSTSNALGQIEEKIDLDEKVDEDFKISFSSKFMMDTRKAFKNDKIIIKFLASDKAIVIKDEKEDNLLHLILPIRNL